MSQPAQEPNKEMSHRGNMIFVGFVTIPFGIAVLAKPIADIATMLYAYL